MKTPYTIDPMQTLNLIGNVDRDGHLRLDVPTSLPAGRVDLVLVIESATAKEPEPAKRGFSDLAGRLRWQGDAVEQQRAMRHEWPA